VSRWLSDLVDESTYLFYWCGWPAGPVSAAGALPWRSARRMPGRLSVGGRRVRPLMRLPGRCCPCWLVGLLSSWPVGPGCLAGCGCGWSAARAGWPLSAGM